MSQQRPPSREPWSAIPTTIARLRGQQALSLRPVNVSRRPLVSPKTTTQPNVSATSKKTNITNLKSPFKLKYEESLSQLKLLQEKLEQQALVACQLERNALEYYYTNDICFDNYDGEHLPQQNSGLHHYYFTSVICRARRERRERHACEEELLRKESRRVQLLEDDVCDNIINGVLAKQRSELENNEKENSALQQHLAGKLAEEAACRECLQRERERQEALRTEQQESAKRMRRLEEGKQKQMEDVDATRLLLAKQREELVLAQAELRRREVVVSNIREMIEQLTRKRKQRT